MIYLSIFVAGMCMAYVLRKLLAIAVYYCGMTIAVVLGWRIIELIDNGFTVAFAMPVFVGAISALVVCILCSSYIRHTLIYFYLRNAIQRDKDNAAKGKLW